LDQVLTKLKEHDGRFDRLEADVSTLKSDVSTLKSDVSTLKSDVSTLKVDVKSLKADVTYLKEDSHKKGILFEEHTSKLDKILEVVLHTYQKMVPREEFVSSFQNHENRIAALELVTRKKPVV
jgi:outer membrane murein-binding lipoprotein Lpp